MIQFTCPNCKQTQERPEQSRGQVVRCDCGQQMRVPAPPSRTAPGRSSSDSDQQVDTLEEVDEPRSRRSSRNEDEADVDVLPEVKKKSRRDEDEEDRPARKRRHHKDLDETLPPEADKLGELRTIHEASKVGPIIIIVVSCLFAVGGLCTVPMCFLVRNPFPLLLGMLPMGLGCWASCGRS